MRRPVVVFLYLAILVGESMWNAIVPLLPAFSDRFALSKVEAGVLLASTSLAILIVSIPAGVLGERVGVRRLTLLAIVLMAVADLGQGLAGSFAALLAARTVFGIGFGILWTAGLAWLSEAAGDRKAQALSLTVTTAGLGGVIGPAFAGVLVQRFGLATPFTISALLTLAVGLVLWLDSSETGRSTGEAEQIVQVVRASARERLMLASLLIMGLGGLIGAFVNLLVPLRLHADGVSTAAIGLAFGASAAIFIGSSALTARLGERAANTGLAAVLTFAAAAVLVILPVSETSAAAFGFLLLRAPITAAMFTVSFPLGVVGARHARIGVGSMAALLNMVWAASALVGPLAAGGIAQAAGDRAAFVFLIALSLVAAAWIASIDRGAPQPATDLAC